MINHNFPVVAKSAEGPLRVILIGRVSTEHRKHRSLVRGIGTAAPGNL